MCILVLVLKYWCTVYFDILILLYLQSGFFIWITIAPGTQLVTTQYTYNDETCVAFKTGGDTSDNTDNYDDGTNDADDDGSGMEQRSQTLLTAKARELHRGCVHQIPAAKTHEHRPHQLSINITLHSKNYGAQSTDKQNDQALQAQLAGLKKDKAI